MGCRELIESLRSVAEEKTLAVWREARQEAEKTRAETSLEIRRMREENDGRRSVAAATLKAGVLSGAEARARMRLIAAERELSKRLFSLAISLLGQLRRDRYDEAFGGMAQELPRLAWRTVSVNPEDVHRAKKYFPDAKIIADEGITGGMDATTGVGSIRVINTLEIRLERAWQEMLPVLVRDIRQEAGHGTSS